MGARRLTGTVDSRDDFFARLTKMATLLESLTAVPRLLSCKEECVASGEDFDSILAGLKSVCTLVLDSEGSEDQGHAVEDRETGADEVGCGDATKGGDGETAPTSGEFEDEGDALESV
ncbi:Uncharacterized protein Rs2_45393 [Raphanus sativus]|nr:Uncharacterized protein Rs2_45393 [Raphanus sativus]